MMGRTHMAIKLAARADERAPANARRDVLYFLAGPALIAAGAATAFHLWPWPVPIASQAQVFQAPVVALILLAGAAGVTMSSRFDLPSAPALRDGAAWGRIALATIGAGALFGAALLGLDAVFGITAGAAKALGASWVNVALPASLAHYAAGGVLVECLYRLAPIPILGWLIGTVLLRRRANAAVFWSLAVVTSLLEPAAQLALVRPGAMAAVTVMIVLTFAANLFEAVEFRRFGWPAPILFRLAFYAVWHCFGPYLSPASSILYPGPH
jgi:hypothetical protein